MPPKKKGDKKKGGKGGKEKAEVEGENPAILIANYNKICKALSIQPNQKVLKELKPEATEDKKNAEPPPPTQLVLDGREPDGSLNPLGVKGMHALISAMLGNGVGMTGGPYKLIKSIRVWHSDLGDDGVEHVMNLFKEKELKVEYLDMMGNKIGVRGCRLFAETLGFSPTSKILTLKLDYNFDIGSDGCRMLCGGLKSSPHLKQLHLAFCNIQSGGGGPLADLISGTYGAKLTILNLQGNSLACDGLAKLSAGVEKSTTLTHLNLSDNSIVCDLESIDIFGTALVANQSLTHLDIMYNEIEEEGAKALQPHMDNQPRIKVLKVDETLPTAVFDKLMRVEKKEKKKKGKKGKKKKK